MSNGLPRQTKHILGLPKYLLCLVRGHMEPQPKMFDICVGWMTIGADEWLACPRCGKILAPAPDRALCASTTPKEEK